MMHTGSSSLMRNLWLNAPRPPRLLFWKSVPGKSIINLSLDLLRSTTFYTTADFKEYVMAASRYLQDPVNSTVMLKTKVCLTKGGVVSMFDMFSHQCQTTNGKMDFTIASQAKSQEIKCLSRTPVSARLMIITCKRI